VAQVPAAEDLLLHVVAQGMLSNPMAPIRWITDAAAIIRSRHGALDWPSLTRFARDNLIGWRLARGLTYARAFAGIDVPQAVTNYRPRLIERVEKKVILDNPGGPFVRYFSLIALVLLLAKMMRDEDRRHIPRLAASAIRRRLGWARP
jgi:hypothetical protein